MEADSTTVESDCYDFNEAIEVGRESPLADEFLKYEGFYKDVLKPMLKKNDKTSLLTWMKENNLIQAAQVCPKGLPGCEMTWTSSRVVDKFQWKCKGCGNKVAIRDNSFFKFIFCTFSITFKIILAWCQDVDVGTVATAFGIKKHIVNHIYDKIEMVVCTRTPVPLGGPDNVVLIELFPDTIGEQLQPDSSRNDASPVNKAQHKILCLADTTQIPTRYWLHMITGYVTVKTENNNTKVQKGVHQEVMNVLEKHVAPGSLYAIGGGKQLSTVYEELKERTELEGVVSTNTLLSQINNVGMKTFLTRNLWKWPVVICEAALELNRTKVQTYLSCSTWRREVANNDPFASIINLIANHNHTQKKKRNKPKKNKTDTPEIN